MDPDDFGKRLERAAGSLDNALSEGFADAERTVFETALMFSSGPFSLAELAADDHPYSTRSPRPPMHPGIINRQSGEFYESWQSERTVGLDELASRTSNDAPYAGFLEHGTSTMIARPLPELVVETAEPWVADRLESPIRAVLSSAV